MKLSSMSRFPLPGFFSHTQKQSSLFSSLRPAFYFLEVAFYCVIAWFSIRFVLDRASFPYLPQALSYLRYASILFCFSYALMASETKKRKENAYEKATPLLTQALFFTVCADYFLIFSNYYLPGILFFILVQNTYRRFLSAPFAYWFCSGSAMMGILLLASRFFPIAFDFVNAFSAFYGGCLLANLLYSAKKGPGWFTLSLTLLLLCDFHVALGHLFFYPSALYPSWLITWTSLTPFLIWGFYLPAQILLAAHADAQLT
ncbi:hypothetical protein [Hominifimenecus sp. rT4P-3]|uniref:hypothetical protein n=1 Tax=Hominifimenecus sp. rT4P-3 TaxID=3242979 RepID=UPI003DA5DE0B